MSKTTTRPAAPMTRAQATHLAYRIIRLAAGSTCRGTPMTAAQRAATFDSISGTDIRRMLAALSTNNRHAEFIEQECATTTNTGRYMLYASMREAPTTRQDKARETRARNALPAGMLRKV